MFDRRIALIEFIRLTLTHKVIGYYEVDEEPEKGPYYADLVEYLENHTDPDAAEMLLKFKDVTNETDFNYLIDNDLYGSDGQFTFPGYPHTYQIRWWNIEIIE